MSSTVPACGGEGSGLARTSSGETISGEAGIQQESSLRLALRKFERTDVQLWRLVRREAARKELIFVNADSVTYPQRPVLPSGSASTGGNVTLIGSQIGVWYNRKQE